VLQHPGAGLGSLHPRHPRALHLIALQEERRRRQRRSSRRRRRRRA
jgi:hypothetical protein